MTDVTLTRDGTTVTFPLVEEGGEILAARTFGKPNALVRSSGGTLNPRVNDTFSGIESLELVGKVFSRFDAHALADLIKSASLEPLTVAVDAPEFPDKIRVAPAGGQSNALTLEFPAGRQDVVDVTLNLTRVGVIKGESEQSAFTPLKSGNGPVVVRVGAKISNSRLQTVAAAHCRATNDVCDGERQAGESHPTEYNVKNKVTNDTFTLSFETIENIPDTLNSLTDAMFRQTLDRDGLGVDFNGLAGLGEIRAFPLGSSPFRQVRQAGRKTVTTPTLKFRRILDTTP
jgi:hypothetical protein